MEFAAAVWDGHLSAAQSETLEKLQRTALRLIGGLTSYCRNESLYLESGLTSLSDRRRQQRLTLLYKLFHEPALRHFHHLLPEMINDPEVRHGRHIMHFKITENPRIAVCENSFVHRTCQQWNALEPQVRMSDTISMFKRHIRGAVHQMPTLREMPRYASNIYNRLKYGCSALKSDLFRANIIESELCDCRLGAETLFHYLFDCPFHDVPREILMFELMELEIEDFSPNILFYNCDVLLERQKIKPVQCALFRFFTSTNRFT